MKILFWMNTGFDSHTTSEHLLSAVIEQLARDDNCVHVIQMNKDGSLPILPQKLIDAGVTTTCVRSKSPDKSHFIARYFNAIKYYWDCRHILKEYSNSEAVFLQSTNVAGIAVWLIRKYMKKTRITINVQDIFPYNAVFSGNLKKKSFAFIFLAAVQRYGYKKSDTVITISDDMKNTLITDGVKDDKIEVIYNWSYRDSLYDTVNFDSVSHIFDKNFFNVVYAGNIGIMQNVEILIEAAKLMKMEEKVWFHIIGNGVYKSNLEAKAREYDISNISFLPMQSPELAPAIYSTADVNVIPLVNQVYKTALPSKTAICLACKKPIIFAIGKDSLFGKRIGQEKNCHVIDSDNAEELADAIRTIMREEKTHSTNSFYYENMLRSANSKKYASLITSGERL